MGDKKEDYLNTERRIFIKGLGAVSLGLVSATMLGGCEAILEQIRNRPIRRRLRTGSNQVDNDIAIYRDAVATMKSLPNSDPRSWFAQAAIHGTAGVGFNFCQHGTDHFFSWHRAYLFFFEKICQQLTGESEFALPYWNWNQNPAIHSAFLDSTSSLYEGSRVNTSVAGVSNFSDDTLNPIFEDENFFSFGSQIESTPHNRGHTRIGGILGGFGSASDPLFWMHHCMVDYCWAKWNLELENDNTNDSGWVNTTWDHFVNGAGDPSSATAGGTTLMPLLAYRYECSRIGRFGCPLDLTALSQVEFKRLRQRVEKGAQVSFDIKKRLLISERKSLQVNRTNQLKSRTSAADFATLLDAEQREERVFLRIRYAKLPRQNDFFVRAFINLPDADRSTPIGSDHYAGAFSFFGTDAAQGHADHAHAPSFLINITDTLVRLRRIGKLKQDEPITVQLVTLPEGKALSRPGMDILLHEIELIVTPIKIKSRQ